MWQPAAAEGFWKYLRLQPAGSEHITLFFHNHLGGDFNYRCHDDLSNGLGKAASRKSPIAEVAEVILRDLDLSASEEGIFRKLVQKIGNSPAKVHDVG